MYSLLFKSFFRTKIFQVSVILLLSIGIISILIGKQYLIKQEKTIVAAQEFQKESIQRNLEYHNDDLGLLLYYLRFAYIKKPSNISAISIGQSDVNPLMQAVTIRGIEGQKYDANFENPSLLMSGNLDLGFVIIYLFPLVLIAISFNLYSEEKELGTWRILAAQTSGKFFQSILYLFFWSALCLWLVSLQKKSSFNALALISIWVVLTVLLPAMVNNYVINKYQVPEALNAMVEQRDGYHEKWDLEKDATMKGFYEAYPQYKNYPVPEGKFSWIWYYAMQHNGDLAAKKTSTEMTNKIMMRNTISEKVSLFVPTMHAQLSFNRLAGTDMISHLNFLKALTNFHENLRLGFYAKIFDENPADSINWSNHEAKFYTTKNNFNWLFVMLPTLLITLIIGFLGIFNLRKL